MTDFSTSRKHSMDYVTVDGVILRTGYSNKRDWYLVCIRELLDNAADFLWEFYKGSNNAAITTEIFKDDNLFHLKVRNSNDNDIPVFSDSDIAAIFDYEGRYGSKQDIHVINRGMLGDALKQILAFGYVLLHAYDDRTEFIDKQWEEPLIIRHNKIEHKYVLEVDKANQSINAKQLEKREFPDIGTDTEIQVVLPIIDDQVRENLDRLCIEEYCRKYPLFTTDISFKFSIIDNSDTTANIGKMHKAAFETSFSSSALLGQKRNSESNAIVKGFLAALTIGPPKAKLTLDFPALHPISVEKWNKTDSIHSYKAEEFARRILNLRNREKTVYDVLRRIREGSNIKRTQDHEISIEKLGSLPKEDRGKLMETYYYQLKGALPPSPKISLPHHTNNKKQRMNILRSRIASLYDIDNEKVRKKHYIGILPDGKVIIKGMEGKKRDRPTFFNQVFSQLVDDYKNNNKFGLTHNILKAFRQLEAAEVDPSLLAYSNILSKDPDNYQSYTPQHKIGKLLNKEPGCLIKFYKTGRQEDGYNGYSIDYRDLNIDVYETELWKLVREVLRLINCDIQELEDEIFPTITEDDVNGQNMTGLGTAYSSNIWKRNHNNNNAKANNIQNNESLDKYRSLSQVLLALGLACIK